MSIQENGHNIYLADLNLLENISSVSIIKNYKCIQVYRYLKQEKCINLIRSAISFLMFMQTCLRISHARKSAHRKLLGASGNIYGIYARGSKEPRYLN